jgi:CheY-like chemotaxis protein
MLGFVRAPARQIDCAHVDDTRAMRPIKNLTAACKQRVLLFRQQGHEMTKKQNSTILIVEAGQALSEVLQNILQVAGYEVLCAPDAAHALRMVRQQQPALVVLGLTTDGLHFLRGYKAKGAHGDVKVIALSNYDTQEKLDETYPPGVDRYLLKAWASPKMLLRMVSDTLTA